MIALWPVPEDDRELVDDSVVYAYGPRGALTQTQLPRTRCCGRWVGDCDCSDKRMEAGL